MVSSTAGMITHHGFPRDTCLVLWGVIKMFIVLVVTTNLISTALLVGDKPRVPIMHERTSTNNDDI